jgi:hypothetical protein
MRKKLHTFSKLNFQEFAFYIAFQGLTLVTIREKMNALNAHGLR